MKPKNFPLRKYLRQCRAKGVTPDPARIAELRAIRTKKRRTGDDR